MKKKIMLGFILTGLILFGVFTSPLRSELKFDPALLRNIKTFPFYRYCLGACPTLRLPPTGPTTHCREATVTCHCTGEAVFTVDDVKVRAPVGGRSPDPPLCIENDYIRSQVSSGPDATRICHDGEERSSTCTISAWGCNVGMECTTPDFPLR